MEELECVRCQTPVSPLASDILILRTGDAIEDGLQRRERDRASRLEAEASHGSPLCGACVQDPSTNTTVQDKEQ